MIWGVSAGRWASLALLATTFMAAACASAPTSAAGPVTVQILAINDFHGNLEAPRTGVSLPDPDNPGAVIQVPAGGAARLGALVGQLSAGQPNTIMVAAGDLIGASPLLSGLFHDEPSIEALSQMGLALSAVGNHEFDKGAQELRRQQEGGCHRDGCTGPHPFKGAGFQYLAASTIETATGETFFPSHAIREFEGVKVGFIGLTLKGTPALIPPSAAIGLEFGDEVETINALVPTLRAQGVEAIVVLLHEGGYPGAGTGPCPSLSGPITEIVPKLDKAVDLVVTGHTHSSYVCEIDGRRVTSAGRYGQTLTRISITLDRVTQDVVASEAENIVVRTDAFPEDPALVAAIASYKRLAEPLMTRQVGRITETVSSRKSPSGESALGDVVADAMLAAGAIATGAFINPGGLRGDIEFAGAGQITYADIFALQPFNDELVVLSMTGRQIEDLLAQQFRPAQTMILQVSEGFSYAWGGSAVVPGSVMIGGQPLDPAGVYRVVTNSFLANGGDGFPAFKGGVDPKAAGPAVAALEAYLGARSPFTPRLGERIRRTD